MSTFTVCLQKIFFPIIAQKCRQYTFLCERGRLSRNTFFWFCKYLLVLHKGRTFVRLTKKRLVILFSAAVKGFGGYGEAIRRDGAGCLSDRSSFEGFSRCPVNAGDVFHFHWFVRHKG